MEMYNTANECAAIPSPGEQGLIQLMGKINDTTAKAMSICQMIDANIFNGSYPKKEPKEIKCFRDAMYDHLSKLEALCGQLDSIARNLGVG